MSWLNRVRDRISNVLERIKERIRATPEDREAERREIQERERITEERFKVTVYEKEPVELRPFSSLYQYSAKTKTYRDRTTGRLVSKTEYQQQLSGWRLDIAGQYIEMAHPLWSEYEIIEGLLRLQELRSKAELLPLEAIELGELFSP